MEKKTSRILFTLKCHIFVKQIFKKMKRISLTNINKPSDQNLLGYYCHNYSYNCNKPKTFNEYLGWLKFNYKNDLWCDCADKLKVKLFLKSLGLEQYLPKTLGIYRTSDEINIDELPDRFVLKTNHDSGSVFICDKRDGTTDFNIVFKKLDDSLKRNYIKSGEWVYEKIKPMIFAEELLLPREGTDLIDYKFFVYNGVYKWGFTGQNRQKDCRFCVFEDDFLIQNTDYIYLRPQRKNWPKRPLTFDQMVKISETIGKKFWFVRVDLYDTILGPRIGELTFFSQSGFGTFSKKQYDYKYEKYFEATPFFDLIKE